MELVQDLPAEPEVIQSDIAPQSLLVRTLVLPIKTSRQAKAAVDLQLDRLSPIPRHMVIFDVAAIGPVAGGTRFAVGIVPRAAVQQAALEAHNQQYLVARTVVEGAPVSFRFTNAAYRDVRLQKWAQIAPNALTLILAGSLLAAAVQWRLHREIGAATDHLVSLQTSLRAERKRAEDREATWGSWTSARADKSAVLTRCALSFLARSGASAGPISNLEVSSSRAKLTFAAAPAASVRTVFSGPGVNWVAEASANKVRTVEISAVACP